MQSEELEKIAQEGEGKVRFESPAGLILDHESGLESALFQLTCLSFLGTFSFLFMSCDPRINAGLAVSLFWILGSAALGGFFLTLSKVVSDYYLFDFELKELHLHRDWGRFKRRKLIRRLYQMDCLALKPSRHSAKSNVWWEYGLCFIDRKGRPIEVLQGFKSRQTCRNLGRRLSALLEIKFEEGEPESILSVKRGSSGPVVSYTPYNASREIMLHVLAVIATLGLLALGLKWWGVLIF